MQTDTTSDNALNNSLSIFSSICLADFTQATDTCFLKAEKKMSHSRYPHLELLGIFILPQFEAKFFSSTFQLANLLCGLGEPLLQLVELLFFLLLQFLFYALLFLNQELPQTEELGSDQLFQISRSPLKHQKLRSPKAGSCVCVHLTNI